MIKNLKTFVRKIRYRGNKLLCPVCDYHADRFIDGGVTSEVFKKHNVVGGGFRKNLICPSCLCNDRERLMYLYIKNIFIKEIQINSNQKIKVLHIAPEHKISAWFLKQTSVEYIAGDKFTKGYVYPDYTIDIDILNTKFNDNTFNAIICNHVLEHIPDDIAAMTEIFRILKAGGRGILQVPLAYGLDKTVEDLSVKTESEREIKFGQYDHVRLYGLDYTDRLKQCGFEVNVVSPEIFLTKTEIEKSAINPSENIFTVLKK